MNFSAWLANWLSRHPLKEPPHHNPAWFTAQVMQRVKASQQPAPAPTITRALEWLSWPRLGFAAALATATIVLVTVSKPQATGQLATAVLREAQLLDALDETAVDAAIDGDADTLAQELQLHDAMMLAQSELSDEQWIEQTMQLLDQLEQDATDDSAAASSAPPEDDELLNEMQRLLDESELGVQS